jgi:DNA-binding winged helix-turn-helix (wHTH) protein
MALFHPGSGLDEGRAVQAPDTDKPFLEGRSGSAGAVPAKISFGPFCLFPTQFLLREGDTSVPLGSRALEILIALPERHRELVSKQDLMARVWPSVFVEPANLTVHMSALRRALRDSRDGNRFIINIPGRGYLLRCLSRHVRTRKLSASDEAIGRSGEAFPWSRQLQSSGSL